MLTLDARLLHRMQYSLLFVLLWSRMAGELSLRKGLLIFFALELTSRLFSRLLEKAPGRAGVLYEMLPPLSLLLLLPLVRVLIPLSSLLPLPANLSLLRFYLYLLPVLPVAVLLISLSVLALRFRPAHRIAVLLYLGAAVLLLSRRRWGLQLPGESLVLAGTLLFLFLLLELLLVLSAGRRDGRISFFPGLTILILLSVAVLFPINRLYEQESRNEGGGLLESSLFRFDFSDFLSLESSISMKDDLVFFMRLEGPGEDWRVRRFVLSAFDEERGFFREKKAFPEAPGYEGEAPLVGESPRNWDTGPAYEGRETLEQEYYLVNFDAGAFLGLNRPLGVTPYENWDSSSFSRIYAVESEVSRAWGWELMDDNPPGMASEISGESGRESVFLDYYTRWNGDKVLQDLAQEITANSYGYYARVKAVEDYLQSGYYYSQNPGRAPDGNQLNYFLFEAKKGYCSYFAFAMTMLCRSIGIPARVALGFWVPGSLEVLNFYPVRADQAHAWVEVYFPRFGWVEFDPTSQIPAPGEEYPFSSAPPEELEGYLKEIIENRDSLEVQTVPPDHAGSQTDRRSGGFGRRRFLFSAGRLFVFLLLVLVLRVRILLESPRRKSIVPRYVHLHLALAGCSSEARRSGESFRSFAAGKNLSELRELLACYDRIRFGYSSLRDLESLDERGRALRKRLFAGSGTGGRMRYLFRLLLFRRSR